MKKLLTLSLVVVASTILFTSCRKDYTCSCTSSGKITIADVKKKDAQAACDAFSAIEAMGTASGSCKLD